MSAKSYCRAAESIPEKRKGEFVLFGWEI